MATCDPKAQLLDFSCLVVKWDTNGRFEPIFLSNGPEAEIGDSGGGNI